jgi:hypothetical protein
MTFAIFTRSRLVVNPDWGMIVDMLTVAIACWGITFSIFGQFARRWGSNVMLRAALVLVSIVVMFHPDGNVAIGAAICVVPAAIYGTYRHGLIAPPKRGMESQSVG